MAEERQIDAISIGIGANISGLKDSLLQAKEVVRSFDFGVPASAKVPLDVVLNTGNAGRTLTALTRKKTVHIVATMTASQTAVANLRKDIRDKITLGGGLKLPFDADLSSAKTIHANIQKAVDATGPIKVQLTWEWKDGPPPTEWNVDVHMRGGGGGGGGTAGGGPAPRGPAPTTQPTGGGAAAQPAAQKPKRQTTTRSATQQSAAPRTEAEQVEVERTRRAMVTPNISGPGGTKVGGRQAAPSPTTTERIITHPARPVTARAGVVATPIISGPNPATGSARGLNAGRRWEEFQPQVGPRRAQGVPPSLDQQIKHAVARVMRTGDVSDIYKVLGPFVGPSLVQTNKGYQFLPGSRMSGYNVAGLEGKQVNLAQLVNEALKFAETRGIRRNAPGPLREFEEFVPRSAKFSPRTLTAGAVAADAVENFLRSAKTRAAANETMPGAYTPKDIAIAGRLRGYVNAITRQMHAEDPKAMVTVGGFSATSGTRGRQKAVTRIKNEGLAPLAMLAGARERLKAVGEPSPDLLADLKSVDARRKELERIANAPETARKNALAKNRERSTVINEKTGRRRTIPARGLPFVQEHGFSDVESFVNMLDTLPKRASGGGVGKNEPWLRKQFGKPVKSRLAFGLLEHFRHNVERPPWDSEHAPFEADPFDLLGHGTRDMSKEELQDKPHGGYFESRGYSRNAMGGHIRGRRALGGGMGAPEYYESRAKKFARALKGGRAGKKLRLDILKRGQALNQPKPPKPDIPEYGPVTQEMENLFWAARAPEPPPDYNGYMAMEILRGAARSEMDFAANKFKGTPLEEFYTRAGDDKWPDQPDSDRRWPIRQGKPGLWRRRGETPEQAMARRTLDSTQNKNRANPLLSADVNKFDISRFPFSKNALGGHLGYALGGKIPGRVTPSMAKALAKKPLAAEPKPGVNWPHDQATYFRASDARGRAYERTGRRWNASTELLRKGFGPETPERQAADRLAMQAEALDERLKDITNKAWAGKALGGPVGYSGIVDHSRYAMGGRLPVFGRGLKGITPGRHYGEVGEQVTSGYGFPYELQRVPLGDIKSVHGVVEERVSEYSKMLASGSELPPIILGPRGIVQDGHHRLETARRAGLKDILAYKYAGKEKDLPPELRKKLGLRALGGRMGRMGRKGFLLESLLKSDRLGSPDEALPMNYDVGWLDSRIPRHSKVTDSPLDLPSITAPESPDINLWKFSKNALGGSIGRFFRKPTTLEKKLSPFFPAAQFGPNLVTPDHKTMDLMEEVAARFSSKFPTSAASVSHIRGFTDEELWMQHIGELPKNGAAFTQAEPRVIQSSHPGVRPYLDWWHPVSTVAFRQAEMSNARRARITNEASMANGGHSPVADRFAGIPAIFAHELGHVVDNTNLLSHTQHLSFPQRSRYGAKDPRENFAEEFKSALLGGGDPHDFFQSIGKLGARALGGRHKPWGDTGAYIVGEQGDEVFVPESAGWIIPHRLMDQLPKRAEGGETGPLQRRIAEAKTGTRLRFREPAPETEPGPIARRRAELAAEEDARRRREAEERVAANLLRYPKRAPVPRVPPVIGHGSITERLADNRAREAAQTEQMNRFALTVIPQPVPEPEHQRPLPPVSKGFLRRRRDMNAVFEIEEQQTRERLRAEAESRYAAPPPPPPGGGPYRDSTGRWHRGGGGRGSGQYVRGPVGGVASGPAGPAGTPPPSVRPATATAGGPYGEAVARSEGAAGLGMSAREAEEHYWNIREERAASIKLQKLQNARVQSDVAQAAARAIGPDFGQILATAGGRGGVIIRRAIFQVAQQQQTEAINRLASLRQAKGGFAKQLDTAIKADDGEAVVKLTQKLRDNQEQIEVTTDRLEKYTMVSDELSKKVTPLSSKLKTLTSNFSGILAGTIIYGTVFKGIQSALDAVVPVLGSFIDEQTGLKSKATAVTSALGEQTKAAHGNVDAVLATAAAEAGLNAQSLQLVSARLKPSVEVKAGAQAQQGASDLYRAAYGAQRGQAPEGLFGGFGGLLGTPLLAPNKGFSETVQGDLSSLGRGQGGPDWIGDLTKGLSYITNPDVHKLVDKTAEDQGNPLFDFLGGVGRGTPLPYINDVIGGVGDQLFRGGKAPEQPQALIPGAPEAPQATDLQKGYIQNLNDQIKRVGGKATYEFTADPKQRALGAAAAAAAGDINGMTSAAQGFVVTLNGAIAGSKEYTTAVEQAARGAALPSAEVVQQELTRQREIALSSIATQTGFQQASILPQQSAVQFFGQRPLAPGTGIAAPKNAPGYGGFGAFDPATATTSFQKYKGIATDALSFVTDYATQGWDKVAQEAQVPPALLQSYKAVGKQILDIQTEIANASATQQAVQYNHQLFIAKRTQQDALALAGKRVANEGTNLGLIERETFLLNRQSTALSLALNQRQINFQRAVAGFQAPGLTSEERGARIAEAKTEADYAQKQLDIQKKLFGLGGIQFNVSSARQLTDVSFALQDLEKGHQIQIDTKLAEQTVGLLNQKLTIQGNLINTYMSQEEAIFAAKIQETATIAATATGTAFSEIFKGVDAAWTALQTGFNAYNAYVSQQKPTAPTTTPSSTLRGYEPTSRASGGPGGGGGGGGGGATASTAAGRFGPGYATGLLTSVSRPTTMTVGEAGTETVAVIRNPQTFTTGSSGSGGGGIVININNPTVRNDTDIQAIARQVEKVMQKHASLVLPK